MHIKKNKGLFLTLAASGLALTVGAGLVLKNNSKLDKQTSEYIEAAEKLANALRVKDSVRDVLELGDDPFSVKEYVIQALEEDKHSDFHDVAETPAWSDKAEEIQELMDLDIISGNDDVIQALEEDKHSDFSDVAEIPAWADEAIPYELGTIDTNNQEVQNIADEAESLALAQQQMKSVQNKIEIVREGQKETARIKRLMKELIKMGVVQETDGKPTMTTDKAKVIASVKKLIEMGLIENSKDL